MQQNSLIQLISAVPPAAAGEHAPERLGPLLGSPEGLGTVVARLCERLVDYPLDALVAISPAGCLLGVALAQQLRLPLLLFPEGAAPVFHPGWHYALVDDVLQESARPLAVADRIRAAGGEVAACAVALEHGEDGTRQQLVPLPVEAALRG